MNAPLIAACACISLMFVLSGFGKLFQSAGCKNNRALTSALEKLTGKPHCRVAQVGMYGAATLELAAPAALMYGAIQGNARLVRLGALALLVFTVVVTLVIKVYVKFRYYGFLSNLALCGGLIAVSTCSDT